MLTKNLFRDPGVQRRIVERIKVQRRAVRRVRIPQVQVQIPIVLRAIALHPIQRLGQHFFRAFAAAFAHIDHLVEARGEPMRRMPLGERADGSGAQARAAE